ncbi:MAG: NADH-quinone oxidoreductase subunit B [Deltaproteobacteria bacterium]|nr:MAG: NADH-quinone oxidoreductase subunit B [Deltaproteobacteria bacterium]
MLHSKDGGAGVVLGSLEEAAEFARQAKSPNGLEKFVNWARKHSLWPIPFGTACCAIEFMGMVGASLDISRFGAEFVRFTPRQCDLMIVAGTIVNKMAPVLETIYEQMAEPKWVISMGSCANSGGMFNTYSVLQGIDRIIPVDYYVPGCPPRPEAVMYAVLKLQEQISAEKAPMTSKERHRRHWIRGIHGRGKTPKARLLGE